MAALLKALCIFGVLLAISLQTNSASIPNICKCVQTIEKFNPNQILNFTIEERGDGCVTEIILTTSRKDAPKLCLDPEEKQGRYLQSCWKRIQMDESRKQECLRRRIRP